MASAVRNLLDTFAKDGKPCAPIAVRIGSPGPIDLRTGVLGRLPDFPGWDDFPLRDALVEATSQPVILESDADPAAIEEWKKGVGRSANLASMAMLTLGTGVGGGLILNREVWQGVFGMAAEVGHSTPVANGLPSSCGSSGCLEMYASANGLLPLASKAAALPQGTPALCKVAGSPDEFTCLLIAKLAEAGAQCAFAVLGEYLGIGIANLISMLDLPVVVVGGGVAASWPFFAQSMFNAVRSHSLGYRMTGPTQSLEVEQGRTLIFQAECGASAGVLGAALLPHLRDVSELSRPLSFADYGVVN
jgi:glucokinase